MRKKIFTLVTLILVISGTIFAQVKQIYWADAGSNQFIKAGIDGSGQTILYDINPAEVKLNVERVVNGAAADPMDVDVDFTNGIVYGITNNGIIFKCGLDGSNFSHVTTGIGSTFGIALNKNNNTLYFSTWNGHIYSISTTLAGGTTELMNSAVGIYGIAVDPTGAKIYFSTGGGVGESNLSITKEDNNSKIMNGLATNSIYRMNSDGTNPEQLVASQSNVYGVDLDLTNNKIYWTNYGNIAAEANKNVRGINNPPMLGQINKSNLDGSNVENILNNLSYPFGISLDVAAGKIYYSRYVLVDEALLDIKTKSEKRDVNIDPGQLFSLDMDGNNLSLLFNVSNPYGLQVENTVPAPPVNESPYLDVNTGMTVDDGTTTTIDQSHLSAVDPDGSNPGVRYNVSQLPAHGTLIINNNANLKIDGSGINITVFRQDDINRGYISYQHDGGTSTSDSFTFTLDDGEGGTSPEYTFDITINQVNYPPELLNIEEDALIYTVGGGSVHVSATIEVTDNDNTDLASATVEIGNYVQGEDILTFTDTDAITHAFNTTTGALTLTGPATMAQFQAALRGVQYENTGGLQSGGTEKLITYTVNDGVDDSDPLGRLVLIQLPTGQNTGLTAPSNIQITYNADGTVTVTWDDNSGNELGFIIYRQTPTGTKMSIVYTYEAIGMVGENMQTFTDQNVTEGIKYDYQVVAYNSDGQSGEVEGQLTMSLVPPSGLEAAENANEYVVLTWTDNSSMENGYKIERDGGGSGFIEIADVDAGTETYTDETVEGGVAYTYRVKAYSDNTESEYSNTAELTTTDIGEWDNLIPEEYSLAQNYPNPFNPSTVIRFGLPNDSNVNLVIYNMLGQKVSTLLNRSMNAGYHEIVFNASSINSGIYFYRIEAEGFIQIKKMILIK